MKQWSPEAKSTPGDSVGTPPSIFATFSHGPSFMGGVDFSDLEKFSTLRLICYVFAPTYKSALFWPNPQIKVTKIISKYLMQWRRLVINLKIYILINKIMFFYIFHIISCFFGMLFTLSLLVSDPLVELVDSLHCFGGVGLTWHHVGLDLGLTSSSFWANLEHVVRSAISCGNSSWAQKDISNSRVHINNLVPLDCNFLVALLDSIVDPFLEVITDQSMNYVANVWAFKFQSFLDDGEGILDTHILAGKGEDLFDR